MNQPPPQDAGAIVNQQQLFQKNVRSWVHYNNLTKSHTQQAGNARKLRDGYEHEIESYLNQKKMMNARIQITGGSIHVAEEKTPPSLSIQMLETILPKYYAMNHASEDETQKIIKFIKQYKEASTKVSQNLKFTAGGPELPKPPL